MPVQLVRALYRCPELPGPGVSIPCKHFEASTSIIDQHWRVMPHVLTSQDICINEGHPLIAMDHDFGCHTVKGRPSFMMCPGKHSVKLQAGAPWG